MRLLLLNCAFFASSTLASSANLATRQYASLAVSLEGLNGKITAFNTQINTLTLNSSIEASSNQLLAHSEALLKAFNDTATVISNAWPFQVLFEAEKTMPQIPKLTSNAELAIESLISKKEVIIKFGQVETIRKQLEAQKAAIDTFTKAISSKLSPIVKPATEALIGELVKVFERGIKAFT